MDDLEKAQRLAALTEMFLGFGQPATEERLRYYGNLTRWVPIEVFQQSCRRAAMQDTSGFPPNPGAIIASALVLAPGAPNPGQPRSLPRWFQDSLNGIKRAEQPKELGPRSGPLNIVETIRDERFA